MSDSGPPPARSGCLTEGEVSRLRNARPGKAPQELALHLAGCERCQARALFGADRLARPRRKMPQMPSPGRALLLATLVVAALAASFYTLRILVGRL